MRYAMIKDGIVVNVISLAQTNAKDFPNAVALKDYPVAIGDKYDGDSFYRDGERISSLDEQLAVANAKYEAMLAEMEDMKSALETLGVTVNG
jgi:hypothetical protein